jgi:hypothetical protein
LRQAKQMSDRQSCDGKPPDPFEQWRATRDAYIEAWAKALNDALKGDASKSGSCAHTTDAVLETLLTASAPFRETLQKITTVTLEQLGIPTRDDFTDIAERMTGVETRLEEIHAKLDRIEKLLFQVHKPTHARAAKRRTE